MGSMWRWGNKSQSQTNDMGGLESSIELVFLFTCFLFANPYKTLYLSRVLILVRLFPIPEFLELFPFVLPFTPYQHIARSLKRPHDQHMFNTKFRFYHPGIDLPVLNSAA